MMGPGFGRGISDALVTLGILLIVAAFALGAFSVWAIPKIWEWLKPIIHVITAP